MLVVCCALIHKFEEQCKQWNHEIVLVMRDTRFGYISDVHDFKDTKPVHYVLFQERFWLLQAFQAIVCIQLLILVLPKTFQIFAFFPDGELAQFTLANSSKHSLVSGGFGSSSHIRCTGLKHTRKVWLIEQELTAN